MYLLFDIKIVIYFFFFFFFAATWHYNESKLFFWKDEYDSGWKWALVNKTTDKYTFTTMPLCLVNNLNMFVLLPSGWGNIFLGKICLGGMGADPSSDVSYCDPPFHYV